MAKSVNRVTLLGNLGKDPELRTTQTGLNVCSFSLATSESYKDKASGEWKETTEWHNIVLWDYLAQKAADVLRKGSKVYIEGKIQTRSYEAKEGGKRYTTEIVGLTMIPLNEKPSGGSQYGNAYEPSYGAAAPKNDFVQESPSLADHLSVEDDDEVPF